MQNFNKERDILAGVEMARRRAEKELGRKCDWDDPTDVALYRADKRSEDRDKKLNRLVPDRVCPVCGQKRAGSRSWVVRRIAVCRSCFNKRKEAKPMHHEVKIFTPDHRYEVDGFLLCQVREKMGLSRSEFARRAGWSRQNQSRIEDGEVTVTQEVRDTILQVIHEHGTTTADASD